eukprot:9498767-Pyramimonas_sp.AAC.1
MASVPEIVGLAPGWDDASHAPFDDLDHMLDAEAADFIDAVPTVTEGAEGQQPAAPLPGVPAPGGPGIHRNRHNPGLATSAPFGNVAKLGFG